MDQYTQVICNYCVIFYFEIQHPWILLLQPMDAYSLHIKTLHIQVYIKLLPAMEDSRMHGKTDRS